MNSDENGCFKIFLLDQDLDFKEFVDANLIPLRFEIVSCQTVEDAIVQIDLVNPGLVLLDHAIFKSDEFGVLKEKLKAIPVIIVSYARLEIDEIKTVFDWGAVDALRKPYDLDLLKSRISTILFSNRVLKRHKDYYHDTFSEEFTAIVRRKRILEIELENSYERILTYSTQIMTYDDMNQRIISDISELAGKKKTIDVSLVNDVINKYTSGAHKIGWDEYENLFNKVHSRFFTYLNVDFPTLTVNEKKLCAYYRMNLTTKQIATITYTSHGAIRIARNRLRKKIQLPKEVSLSSFLQNY